MAVSIEPLVPSLYNVLPRRASDQQALPSPQLRAGRLAPPHTSYTPIFQLPVVNVARGSGELVRGWDG